MEQITRRIGIDAGHRVTYHHSKCRSLHGHRYEIEATCQGPLATSGSTDGMVGGLDFGFLKEEMMAAIDAPCDHALILWRQDPLVDVLIPRPPGVDPSVGIYHPLGPTLGVDGTKLYLMDAVPTAENLADHSFSLLSPRVHARSNGLAVLARLRVYETPNCWADRLCRSD